MLDNCKIIISSPLNPTLIRRKKMHSGNESFIAYKPQTLTYCRHVLFAFITLGIIVFMIYSNSFNCSWHFDDEHTITDNPNIHMKDLSWDSLKRAFHSDQNHPQRIYRPVSCLSFVLNYYLGGLDVSGYHLVNISIHFITAVFLFLFIYQTLNLPLLRDRYAEKAYFIAILSTVLWAINPVQGQAVTYIVQRMASMAGMFYIMSMYLYLKVRTTENNRNRFIFYFLGILTFLLALGSKENAVMIPFSLALFEIFLLQETPWLNIKRHLKIYLGIIGLLLLAGLLYVHLKHFNIFEYLSTGYQNRPFTLCQRLLTEPRVTVFYISLLLYPVSTRLNIAHDINISTSLFTPLTTIISLLLITVIIVLALYKSKKYPLVAFSVCFFFLNHIVESSFLPLELIYEHRNYIPSMFFPLSLVIGFSAIIDYYSARKPMKYILLAFIILYLVGLGHSTFIRNFTWKNPKSLWIDAIEKAPGLARSHHNLGRYYQDNGYMGEAFSEYQKAFAGRMTHRKNIYFYTYYNLGKLFSDQKDYVKAEFYYRKALEINPKFPAIYINLATIYDMNGDAESAYEYIKKAFNFYPNNPVTNLNLGLYYIKMNMPEKAIFHLERSSGSGSPSKQNSYMGIAYNQKGLSGKAIIFFKEAIKNEPSDIMSYLHMAEIYSKKGHRDKARKSVKKALSLMIGNKSRLRETLHGLLKRTDLKNIQPDPDVILPLIKEAIRNTEKELDSYIQIGDM
jgi:tetratricopeptide (TPR) repeat protein